MTDAVDAEFLVKLWQSHEWGRDSLTTNDAGYVYSPWIRFSQMSQDPYHQHENRWQTDRHAGHLKYLFAAMLGLDPDRQVMTHSKTDNDDLFTQYIRFSSAVAWINPAAPVTGIADPQYLNYICNRYEGNRIGRLGLD